MGINMFNTELLIVGAGPTGLMMACQLVRYGIKFRIIDKENDRARESRAFAIQARSMEIFQVLGFADEFIKLARAEMDFVFFIHGKQQVEINFSQFERQDTPFPSVYFLPQPETESIFIRFLEKHHVFIERGRELISFTQDNKGVKATIKDRMTGSIENSEYAYIIGCDGAHSTVRHTLNFSFEGGAYQQEFILVDAAIIWPYSINKFMFFLGKDGIFVHIPLTKKISRIMLAQRTDNKLQQKDATLNLNDIERIASRITQVAVKLTNPLWLSQFRLHHRGVKQYSCNRAFLAGDAAHIHSPVGGQGMNTGIQDVTNLAWKLSLVLRKGTTVALLDSYDTERRPVGRTLLKTTDRFFSLLTGKGFLVSKCRDWILALVIPLLFSKKGKERLFWFISQLNIHYAKNRFLVEDYQKADALFNSGPHVGHRAPDAAANSADVFTLLAAKPITIFVFYTKTLESVFLQKLETLRNNQKEWIQICLFPATAANKILFKRYGVTASAIYVIRPDGYIGFRSCTNHYGSLENYLKIFFTRP